jgi:cytochrome b6-f complex iron-sulfur subunit
MDQPRETRRAFCAHTCRAVSLVALGGALSTLLDGCASPLSPSNVGSLPTVNASVAGNSLLMTIDASSPLSTVGNAALVQSSLGFFLVARISQTAFTALGATCTHQTCTITGFGSQKYICPCHGSQFDTSGRVVLGPAPTSLPQYSTQFSNNVLTIIV